MRLKRLANLVPVLNIQASVATRLAGLPVPGLASSVSLAPASS